MKSSSKSSATCCRTPGSSSKWSYHDLDERQRLVAKVTKMSQPITAEYWRESNAHEEEEGDPFEHHADESDDDNKSGV